MSSNTFTPMTGDELQRARRIAAERFTQIAMLYVPVGIAVEYRKNLSGCATKGKIEVPRPVTRKSLYIFLHECAHVHLGHIAPGNRTPRHVEEMEAERWAHAKMREHGIAVPRSMTSRAKRYVARKIRQAEKRGAKRIDAKARKFVGKAAQAAE